MAGLIPSKQVYSKLGQWDFPSPVAADANCRSPELTHYISVVLSLILYGILTLERLSNSHSDPIPYYYSASLGYISVCWKPTGNQISRWLTLQFPLSNNVSIFEQGFRLIGEWFTVWNKEMGFSVNFFALGKFKDYR